MVSTGGGIAIAVVVIVVAAAVGWIVFTQWRAKHLGQPPPSLASYLPWHKPTSAYGPPRPATGGVVGWINDQARKFKNRNNRSAAGSYEASGSSSAAARRGFGPLDPDEAWDSRVGNEADMYSYNEGTELGHHGGSSTEYSGGLSGVVGGGNPYSGGYGDGLDARGRSPGLPLGKDRANPFDDDNASSLRGISPRPMDSSSASGGRKTGNHLEQGRDSMERKSHFREGNM